MKNSWTSTFRRLAAGAVVAGSAALSSAMCYAQSAYDSAYDTAYANGWQAGDNGGFGFTPWDFSASYTWYYNGVTYVYANPGFKAIDDGRKMNTQFSNPNNDIRKSWVMGTMPTADGGNHVGRGFAPLQINQKIRVVIDNPTQEAGGKGYFVSLHGGTGGTDGNLCPGTVGYNCTAGEPRPQEKMRFQMYEFAPPAGEWEIVDAAVSESGVTNDSTAADGALLTVTRTGANTYDLLLKPLNGDPAYSASRTFDNPGVDPDWIEFTFFNTNTDTDAPFDATDLYIHSMMIVPEPGTFSLLVLGAGTMLGLGTTRRRKQ